MVDFDWVGVQQASLYNGDKVKFERAVKNTRLWIDRTQDSLLKLRENACQILSWNIVRLIFDKRRSV